jgi:2-C-methyl-D-erythritol 4-phosphate cytidylyltransferase
MSIIALILAGGSGSRTGSSIPKQFYPIRGVPLIVHTISRFEQHPSIDRIIIVSREDDIPAVQAICKSRNFNKIDAIIKGGSYRQESSYNGVFAAQGNPDDIILIHDAARPFLKSEVITQCIESARRNGASIAAAPPIDTILTTDGSFIKESLDRTTLLCAQTPQAFTYSLITEAHKKAVNDAFANATDDSVLVTRLHKPCAYVLGNVENIKVTTEADLLIAEQIAGIFKD